MDLYQDTTKERINAGCKEIKDPSGFYRPRTLRAYTSRIDGVTRRQEIDGTLTAYLEVER